jgi:DNA topoisomerase I
MSKQGTVNDDLEPRELARLARLRYVSNTERGYARERNGHGFVYLDAHGARLRNPREIARVEHLAIPPAWRDVWICRFATGHLQATGQDDRKRTQYLYHERWREVADLAKFIRIEQFGQVLPKLRRAVARDLKSNALSRTRVLAGIVGLLDATSIRVGNEEYVRQNGSYGLTTLRTRHVTIKRGRAELRFRGKSGLQREVAVDNSRLVRLLQQLKRLRGAHVFQYLAEDGRVHKVTSTDVNDYIREVTNHTFTAKDFRTWKASALAAGLLYRELDKQEARAVNRVVQTTLAAAAELLGNTVAVCRRYYVHSGLFQSFENGNFGQYYKRFVPRRKRLVTYGEQVLSRFLGQWKTSRERLGR